MTFSFSYLPPFCLTLLSFHIVSFFSLFIIYLYYLLAFFPFSFSASSAYSMCIKNQQNIHKSVSVYRFIYSTSLSLISSIRSVMKQLLSLQSFSGSLFTKELTKNSNSWKSKRIPFMCKCLAGENTHTYTHRKFKAGIQGVVWLW